MSIDADTQPHGIDFELRTISEGAATLGRIAGRAAAAAQIHRQAYYQAVQGELAWAGLPIAEEPAEVIDEEFHPDLAAEDLLHQAWGLIANAGWDAHRGLTDLEKTPGWHEAALKWRDRFHALIAEPEPGRPRVVVLCGSTRFYDAFQQANYDETMAGRIVLSVGFYPHAKALHGHGEGVGHDSAEKVSLDELHKRKIDLADEVLVLNVGGYTGKSTRAEIAYATALGKPIRWWEPPFGERPFVACKAPDPINPNRFCRLHIGHTGTTPCRYVYADQLPASADDEGDGKCSAVSPFGGTPCIKPAGHLEAGDPVHDDSDEPGQEGAESADDPFVEVLQAPAEIPADDQEGALTSQREHNDAEAETAVQQRRRLGHGRH